MTPAHSPENLRKTDELNVMHQKIDATKSYEKMYAESAKALKEMKRYCDTYLKNTTGQDNTVFAEKNISQKEKQSPFDKALLELMNTATLLSQKIDKVNIYNIAKTELLLKTGIHRPLSEHIFEDQTVERTKKNEIRGKLWNVWTRTTQELTAEVDSYEHLISDKFVSPEQRKIALINISQDVGQHMAYNSKESERAPYAKSLSEGKVIYALAYMNEFVGPFNVLYESLTERAKANNTDIVSFINKNVPASLRGDILGNLEAQVIGRNNLTNRLSLTANKSSQTLATDIMKYPAYTENFLNIRPHLRKTHPKRAMEIAKAFTRSNPNIYKLLTEKDKKQSSLELFTTKKFNCLSIYGPKGEG
ncbi:hypothetical protein KBC03_03670 [Patescibacteria group bacterium]|nr:hypothetical protein [Patescibacteria group bacterium]